MPPFCPPEEGEVFNTFHDMVHAAILSAGAGGKNCASLKEIYAACTRFGRVKCRKTGGWRLVTERRNWKSHIRHTLYTTEKFLRCPQDSDSWTLAPAFLNTLPQTTRQVKDVGRHQPCEMASEQLGLQRDIDCLPLAHARFARHFHKDTADQPRRLASRGEPHFRPAGASQAPPKGRRPGGMLADVDDPGSDEEQDEAAYDDGNDCYCDDPDHVVQYGVDGDAPRDQEPMDMKDGAEAADYAAGSNPYSLRILHGLPRTEAVWCKVRDLAPAAARAVAAAGQQASPVHRVGSHSGRAEALLNVTAAAAAAVEVSEGVAALVDPTDQSTHRALMAAQEVLHNPTAARILLYMIQQRQHFLEVPLRSHLAQLHLLDGLVTGQAPLQPQNEPLQSTAPLPLPRVQDLISRRLPSCYGSTGDGGDGTMEDVEDGLAERRGHLAVGAVGLLEAPACSAGEKLFVGSLGHVVAVELGGGGDKQAHGTAQPAIHCQDAYDAPSLEAAALLAAVASAATRSGRAPRASKRRILVTEETGLGGLKQEPADVVPVADADAAPSVVPRGRGPASAPARIHVPVMDPVPGVAMRGPSQEDEDGDWPQTEEGLGARGQGRRFVDDEEAEGEDGGWMGQHERRRTEEQEEETDEELQRLGGGRPCQEFGRLQRRMCPPLSSSFASVRVLADDLQRPCSRGQLLLEGKDPAEDSSIADTESLSPLRAASSTPRLLLLRVAQGTVAATQGRRPASPPQPPACGRPSSPMLPKAISATQAAVGLPGEPGLPAGRALSAEGASMTARPAVKGGGEMPSKAPPASVRRTSAGTTAGGGCRALGPEDPQAVHRATSFQERGGALGKRPATDSKNSSMGEADAEEDQQLRQQRQQLGLFLLQHRYPIGLPSPADQQQQQQHQDNEQEYEERAQRSKRLCQLLNLTRQAAAADSATRSLVPYNAQRMPPVLLGSGSASGSRGLG